MHFASLSGAVLALFVASAGIAQEPARDAGFGRVTDAAGKPWIGAEVHLVHRAHPAVADPAFADAITVRTDERGQFRTQLLPGAAYAAWAVGDGDAPELYRVTGIANHAVARTPILLRESQPHYRRRLRPEPDASWTGKETLRWRATARLGDGEFAEWLTADADGTVTLPPWPVSTVTLQLWAGDWQAHAVWLSTTVAQATRYGVVMQRGVAPPSEAEARDALAAVTSLRVPPRHAHTVQLRDAATGTPVRYAEVRLDAQPFDVPTQRSDADGNVSAVFASEEQTPSEVPFSWCILPNDHAENRLMPSVSRADDPPVTARDLAPGTTVRGRLLLTADQPAAAVPLVLEATIGTGASSMFFGARPRVLRTAADGTFALPGRTEQFPYRLTAVLSPTLRAQIARADPDWPIAESVVLRWLAGPEPIGDLRLDQLVRLDVTVRQTDGTPPGATPVALTRLGGAMERPCQPLRAVTDHRGHLRLWMPATEGLLVHAMSATGAAFARPLAGDRAVDLTLDARHVAPFAIVDRNGAPVPDAHVHLVGIQQIGAVDPIWTSVGAMCSVNAFPHASVDADAAGLGTMVLPLLGPTFDLSITGKGVDARVRVPWNGPASEPRLTIRLP